MKITKKQLRQIIAEAIDEPRTAEQKIAGLMASGIEGLIQAQELAFAADLDIFNIFASSHSAVDAVLGPFVARHRGEGGDIQNLIYAIADNSMYGGTKEKPCMSFFPALLDQLPNYPSLSLGMSSGEIVNLISNEGMQGEEIYQTAEGGLGMSYSSALAGEHSGGMGYVLEEWLIGLYLLKLVQIKNMLGPDFGDLSDEIENLFGNN